MDFGKARIGVAYSPGDALVTVPLDYVSAHPRSRAIRQIASLVSERRAIEVVVGLPRHLNGTEGASAQEARRFAKSLADKLPTVRVCLVDERRSTLSAQGILHDFGVEARKQRPLIDSIAAQVILEQALELERVSGRPPGEAVVSPEDMKDEDE